MLILKSALLGHYDAHQHLNDVGDTYTYFEKRSARPLYIASLQVIDEIYYFKILIYMIFLPMIPVTQERLRRDMSHVPGCGRRGLAKRHGHAP
jgi:hypothetical protein